MDMPKLKIFKGLTHVHSTYSFDGQLSLSQMKALLRDHGYHFVLMSEHIEGLSPQEFSCFLEECKELTDESFIFVPGLEFHAECISINGLKHPLKNMAKGRRQLLEECLDHDTFNIFVHPSLRRSLPNDKTLKKVHAIEVWNAKYDGARYPSPQNIRIWRKRCGHQKVTPIFGVDFHENNQLVPIYMSVELEHLSPDGVVAAFKAGKYSLHYREKILDPAKFPSTMRASMLAYWVVRRIAVRSYRTVSKLVPDSLNRRLKAWINGRRYS